MNPRSDNAGIDGGRVVVAAGALLLLVSLFLDWYGFGRGAGGDGFSAWTAFELVDILLALFALAAVAALAEPFLRRTRRLPETIGAFVGPAAIVLIAISLINPPPAAQSIDSELEIGAWLGLAGAAIMCAGALLAFNRVSLVVTPRERPSDVHAAETKTQPLPERQNP